MAAAVLVLCPTKHVFLINLSDSSAQWRQISDEDRERLSHRSEDGEFW